MNVKKKSKSTKEEILIGEHLDEIARLNIEVQNFAWALDGNGVASKVIDGNKLKLLSTTLINGIFEHSLSEFD